MGRNLAGKFLLQGVLGKVFKRDVAEQVEPPSNAPMAMLERLHAGENPDYCLYLRPPLGGPAAATGPLAVDLEELFAKAFDPLPIVTLDEGKREGEQGRGGEGEKRKVAGAASAASVSFSPFPPLPLSPAVLPLPDEAFLTLANRARVLLLAPTDDARFIQRLGLIKSKGPLNRSIFVMPDAGTLGAIDWPGRWPGACAAAATLGIELSGYSAGGWLFRLDSSGKACTFRPIINPNSQKIARALEGICGEMS